jgi:hypothetical protein
MTESAREMGRLAFGDELAALAAKLKTECCGDYVTLSSGCPETADRRW